MKGPMGQGLPLENEGSVAMISHFDDFNQLRITCN